MHITIQVIHNHFLHYTDVKTPLSGNRYVLCRSYGYTYD